MPWTCPACQTWIRRDDETPRPNTVYRCSVCRLELVFDDIAQKLTVAPLPYERDDEPARRPRRL